MLSTTRPKPIIEKINFGELEEEVKRLWAGEPPTSTVERWEKQGFKPKFYYAGTLKCRYARIQKLLGYSSSLVGHCSVCYYNLNSHIMKEQVAGATIITRFCEQHLPVEFDTK